MLSEAFALLNEPLMAVGVAFAVLFAHFLAAEVDDGF